MRYALIPKRSTKYGPKRGLALRMLACLAIAGLAAEGWGAPRVGPASPPVLRPSKPAVAQIPEEPVYEEIPPLDPETGLPYEEMVPGAEPPIEEYPAEGLPAEPEPALPEGEYGEYYEEQAPEEFEPAPVEPEPAPAPPPPPVVRPRTQVRPRAVQRPAPAPPARPLMPTTPSGVPSDDLKPDQPASWNFEDADLIDVIRAIGPYTGKNFDVSDPQLAGAKVTIIMHEPIDEAMAYEVLESILATRGFALVPAGVGNLIKVVAPGTLPEKTPLVVGAEPLSQGYDRLVTHIVPVEYASASDLQQILPSLGSMNASVDAYVNTNTLIITDTADGVRRMLALLRQLDIPGYDTDMEIFMLEYTSAAVVSQQIQEVLLEGAQQPGVPQPGQPVRPVQRAPIRPTLPNQPRQSQVVGQREEVLRIVPDERLNALIVVATASMMERVRDLIDRLDMPAPVQFGNMHIYELQNANAEDMMDTLNSLVGAAPPAAPGGGGGGGGGGAPGAAPATQVAAFEKEVSITSYEQGNALLIVASPQDYARLVDIIARLDIPQRQVHVDATILEVSITDNFSLAVETTALTANDAFALNNVVQLANLLTQGPLGLAGAGAQVGILDGTTEVTVNTDAGPITREIPNVPLLLTALENISDINILSHPSLTTVDNTEANIVDGFDIPFIRGSSTSLDQPAIGRSIFNQIDREEVGMKLRVTPQISEGEYVYLKLEVELSQPVQSSVGADPNIVGPTIQTTNINDEVVVKDGAIGVIGGFIRESTDRVIRQPPILGDVPLVGWLFRRKDNSRQKRNLVMLVSPHILKERRDLDRLTEYKLQQFDEANADVVFEQGFIRKIERKQYVRNRHRPSIEAADKLQEEHGFSRGEIKR